jgi:transposase, IS5 family
MQKPLEQTNKMLLMKSEKEVFDAIVPKDHPLRRLAKIVDFTELAKPLYECYSHTGMPGEHVERGLKALTIQFLNDYSDRQMERAVQENMAVRLFCGYSLTEKTPDHSYFGKLRARIGTKRVANLFKEINTTLDEHGLFGHTFSFMDASAIVTKNTLWKERDEAIAKGEGRLSNAVVHKYAADKDARFGAKSKKKIWYGYKRHETVDMRHGLVSKVATTPANVPDFKMAGSIAPKQGAVFADKLYDTKKTDMLLRSKGLHTATIRKRTNSTKNRDLDRWRSSIRMPFEGTFSKRRKRTKYRSIGKVTMQCFFEAIAHNLKKAILFVPEPVST